MITHTHTHLSMQGLELPVRLGWPKEERVEPQRVLVDWEMVFIHPPTACENDYLENTVCYLTLTTHLREKIGLQEFYLLEHLTKYVHDLLKQACPPLRKLSVRITKFPACIEGLTKGVSFTYMTEYET